MSLEAVTGTRARTPWSPLTWTSYAPSWKRQGRDYMSDVPPSGEAAQTSDDDAARWQVAKQIRAERPGWVVIWIARTRQFKAYPKFSAPRGTAPTAETPEDLVAQVEQIERATRRPGERSRQPGGN